MTPTTKAITGTAIAATIGTGTVLYQVNEPSEFTTHIGGSAALPHDIAVAWEVDGNVDFDGACHVTPDNMPEVKAGDIWFTPRAYTAEICNYNNPVLPSIAIMGWDNKAEFIGDKKIPNTLTLSDGSAFGRGIDYYVQASSLSFAMPKLANIVMSVNEARLNSGLKPLDTDGIRRVLDKTAAGEYIANGRYYGRVIRPDLAIQEAIKRPVTTAATSTPWMAGIHYLLIGD